MTRSPFWLLFLLPLISWPMGCATPAPPPRWQPLDTQAITAPLSLEQCLILAREHDVQAAAWEARMKTARAELQKAREIPNPTFSPAWDDLGLKDDIGTDLSNLVYGFSFPIFFWWPQSQKIAAARANQMVEEAAVRSEQRQLTIDVAAAYFNLVAEQRKTRISEQLLAVACESLRLVEKQRQLQIVSEFDVERIRADELQAESDWNDARNQQRLDQLAFAFALGADHPFYPEVQDPKDAYSQPLVDIPAGDSMPEEWLQSAVAGDPLWMKAQAATRVAEAQLAVERRGAFPLTDAASSAGPKSAPEGTGSAVTLDIPIPIFNQNQAAIARARADLLTAQTEQEQTRRAVIAKISSAWEEYQASRVKWDQYARKILEFEEKNEQAASKFFVAGQIPYIDLLQVRNQFRKAQLSALDSWKDYVTSAWTLSCLLGKQDPAGVDSPHQPEDNRSSMPRNESRENG
ncbi:MAG: TolC family protein [bacterium]